MCSASAGTWRRIWSTILCIGRSSNDAGGHVHERRQLFLIKLSICANAAANVQAERAALADGISDVGSAQTAGEEKWNFQFLANLPANRPVVAPAGAAEFFD